jgi:hypothetical protein
VKNINENGFYKPDHKHQRRGTLTCDGASACFSTVKKVSHFDKKVGEGSGKFYEKLKAFGSDAKKVYISKTPRPDIAGNRKGPCIG